MHGYFDVMVGHVKRRINKLEAQAANAWRAYEQQQDLFAEQQKESGQRQSRPASCGTSEKAIKAAAVQQAHSSALLIQKQMQQMEDYLEQLEIKIAAHDHAVDKVTWEELQACKSDLYSFGCLMIELLTHGELPLEPLLKKDTTGCLGANEAILLQFTSFVSAKDCSASLMHRCHTE